MNLDEPTLALACELIERVSVTPEDAGCQDILRARLEPLGFECTELVFGDTRNLWAVWGSSGPLFVFAGHTDVVPTGPLDEWNSAPFSPELRDGLLYGRGAADMKGSIAAMVSACEALLRDDNKPNARIGFLITSDEEGPATNGTVKVMEWLDDQGVNIDYCLVGEPSSSNSLGDTIKNGRRGSLNGKLQVIGQQGHVAYPHSADNPIHRALTALTELAQREWDSGNAYFPPTSFQITNIHSGTGATNVIPGTLELLFNFRFSTEQTAAGLQTAVEDCLQKHQVKHEVEWVLSGEPFITEAGALVNASQTAIHEVLNIDTQLSTSGGTSDGRFIAPYGAELIELGPINASIHQVNEHVLAEDLPQLARVYQRILEITLGS